MVGRRRTGICNDGLYQINTRETDSSGNPSNWNRYPVERDTVVPNLTDSMLIVSKSNASYNGQVDRFEEYLNLSLTNVEDYATALISVRASNDNSRKDKTLNFSTQGSADLSNIWGDTLQCGNITYTVTVSLQDRANNSSQTITKSIVSSNQCAACGIADGTGTFIHPIQEPGRVGAINDYFGVPRGDGLHAGVDFQASLNDSILAVYPGVVAQNGYEDKGFGHYVVIKHTLASDPITGGSSILYSIYAHLNTPSSVVIGRSVSQGQTIGYAGSTGWSSGVHLHFQLQREGAISPSGMSQFTQPRTNGAGVVNPLNYFPASTTNIPNFLSSKYCSGGLGTGKDHSIAPTISKEQAQQEVAHYIKNNLGWWSQIENWKNKDILGNNWQQYNSRAKNLPDDKKNDIESIQSLLDVYSVCSGNRWIQNMGRVDNGDNTKRAGDGLLMVNPWNLYKNIENKNNDLQTVFLVQDDIFSDYSDTSKIGFKEKFRNYGCDQPLGYVASEQGTTTMRSDSIYTARGSTYQRFQNRSNADRFNSLYSANSINTRKTYMVIGDVVNEYESNGGTAGKYGFPVEDTVKRDTWCQQKFEKLELSVCPSISGEIAVNAYGSSEYINLHIMHSDNSDISLKYDGDSEVWVVSHGMLDTWSSDGMKAIDEGLWNGRDKSKKTIILNINWTGSQNAGFQRDPQATDQWIRPSAEVIYQELKKWGLTDPSKVNFVGHSMGSMIVNEVARQYNLDTKQPVKNIFYLDPPNYWPLRPGWNEFRVDDRYGEGNARGGSQDAVYSADHGYTNHAQGLIQRSFNGRNAQGADGMCGNTGLAKTAKESYIVQFIEIQNDTREKCPAHASVNYTFGELAGGRFGSELNHYSNSLGQNKSNYFQSDDNMDGVIMVRGKNESTDVQNYTLLKSDGNRYQEGKKDGMGTMYSNFPYNAIITSERRTIQINDFANKDDRISLENEPYGVSKGAVFSSYTLKDSTIYRTIFRFIGVNPEVEVEQYPDMIIRGERADKMNQDKLNEQLNLAINGQANDWFILR